MRRWWVSWYADGDTSFEWHGPWWISGHRPMDRSTAHTIVAAVVADDADDAKAKIVAAHDKTVDLEWRFREARNDDWSPFCERFPRADWMRWPWPEERAHA